MAGRPGRKPKPRKSATIRQRLAAQAKQAGGTSKDAPGSQRHRPDLDINKAQIAWQQRRFDEAIWYYERALARDSCNAVLLVDVARAYALRYRFADSQTLVDRAESLYPDDAHLQGMLGRTYVQLKQFDRAITCFRRALELETNSAERPRILLELATMHERLHELDIARDCANQALSLAPYLEKARYLLSVIDRRAGDSERAETGWRTLIETGKAPPGVIADAWYQLAALHDSAGRYDEAFANLIQAKQILNRAATPYRYDADAIANVVKTTFGAMTREHCQRWHAASGELNPLDGSLALLTSHPRSGTTLLEQVLDSHPGIISADELQIMAELVYVPLGRTAAAGASVTETLDLAKREDLHRVRRDYRSSMEGALREPLGGRLLLDKNPELTQLLPLVARVFPEMPIVFALRDPRDVVVSCFMQRLPLNAVSVHYLTLEGTARKYAATMRAWLAIRPMLCNPWIEVRYEDTVDDLQRQARRVLDFLGLPWDDAVLQYYQRAQHKHVHSPTYESVTMPVYSSSVGRWRHYAAQLAPVREILQPFVEALGY